LTQSRKIYARAEGNKLVFYAPKADGGTEYFKPIEGTALANLLVDAATALVIPKNKRNDLSPKIDS